MKRLIYVAIGCLTLLLVSCQKEISYTNPELPGTGSDPVTATLQGNVVDENGNPAQGVSIVVGSKTVITDTKGYFRVKNASLDKSTSLVTAQKSGYFKAFRVFSASKAVNQVKIKLVKKINAGTLNSASGGIVTLANGSAITFSANSFSNASGGAYSGTVNVYAAYIDPTTQDISETVPGSFLGNDKDNKKVILASYGMMAVELESPTGEKLQITSNSTAKLDFNIPLDLRTSAPSSIPLWYIDENTGIWKEEGSATKNGGIYTGNVKHFTYWNCDVPGSTVNATATFVNQNGQPLIYTTVIFRPQTGYASAHGYTDSLGQINGSVPANINLVLEVMSPCYTVIYSQNVGPFSTNVNLGTITVNNVQSLLTIKGKLLNCSGNAVTNGYAEIVYDNMVRYASTNSVGDFTITFSSCNTLQTTCVVTGVDSLAQQQGSPTTIAVTQSITNAGNIAACGTSTIEYVSYTVDGNPVNISSNTAGDTFSGADTIGVVNHLVFIQGYRSQMEHLSFDFDSDGNPGTFPLIYLNVNSYGVVTPIQPCTVSLSQHPAVIGGYFEGSFSGQFKDAQNITHNLSGTLRVKRRQ